MTASTLSNKTSSSPLWLKIIAVLGIVWYAFGLLQFWLGYTLDTEAAIQSGEITASHGAAIASTPGLIWIAFAIASGAGLVGSILLLRTSRLARNTFAISLISAFAYYAWVYVLSGSGNDRPSEELIIAAVVLAVTAGFLLLSHATSKH